MPTKSKTLITILLAVSAGTAAAAPSGAEDRFPISIDAAETRLQERLAALDTDGSETISLSEYEQADMPLTHRRKPMQRRHRGEGRARHDGARHGQHAERMEAHREAMQAEVFAIMDSDGDGAISESEHAAADRREVRTLAMKRTMFKRLDEDADGLLQFSELSARLDKLRAADSDGDGQVTREEMRAHRLERRSAAEASSNG